MASSPAARALRAVMHHEKQEQGSMLCAQHALNALLQGSYYDPSQLADIAAQMDDLEHAELDEAAWEARGRDEGSLTVDATGFFSLGVMEAALGIWNLSLERWRSASMREHHDAPEEQAAFVLNLQQHWFTIRGFGRGWWFNLNSHINEPAWVGPSYLGALLDQCETEGYSVFVVRATGTPNPLHTSPADELARTLPSAAAAASGAVELSPALDHDSEEDADLQAALRASMAQAHIGGSAAEAGPSSSRAAGSSASGSSRPPHGTRRARSVELGSDDELRGGLGMGDSGPETDAHVDALAPSRQRARLLPQSLPHASGARNRRRASRARHGRDEQSGSSRDTAISLDSDEDEDASQDGTASAHRSPFLNPVLAGAALDDIEDLDDDDDEVAFHSLENSDEERGAPAPSGPRRDRTYDDEDADLQRALAASMRDANGFEEDGFAFTSASRQFTEHTPPPADVDRISKLRAEAKRKEAQAQEDVDRKARGLPTRAEEESKAASGNGAEDSSDEDDEPAEVLSPDEIRRRRLARFGA